MRWLKVWTRSVSKVQLRHKHGRLQPSVEQNVKVHEAAYGSTFLDREMCC